MPSRPPQHRPAHHKPASKHQNNFADRLYDRERGSPESRGYDAVWRRLRQIVIAEEPLCRACLAEDRLTATAHIDHILPISDRPDLRLVRDNLQGLCVEHHNQKTAAETRARNAKKDS